MNRIVKKMCLTGLVSSVVLLSGSLSTQALASAKISNTNFKSTVLVSQDRISADKLLKSECAPGIKARLSKIQVGVIPDPLGELVLKKSELEKKLGKVGKSLDLPDSVVIRRQGSILKGNDICERLKKVCLEGIEGKTELDLSRIPRNVVLPGNIISWNLVPKSKNRIGMRLFHLIAQTEGGEHRQLLQVSVAKIAEVAQLTRLAKPGEILTEDMLTKKIVKVKSDKIHPPIEFEEALGKCLGRFKSQGTIIRSSDLSSGENSICKNTPAKVNTTRVRNIARRVAPTRQERENWVVKPGDKVNYHFKNGTISLSFPAKAIQGGDTGDSITLINLNNSKRVKGMITAQGDVVYEN